jgi:HEAT repeat protein
MRHWISAHAFMTGAALLIPGACLAQVKSAPTQPLPLALPAPMDAETVQIWGKSCMEKLYACWGENNADQRSRRLQSLVEETPAGVAYVTGMMKRPELSLRLAAIGALKDLISMTRRFEWQAADRENLQKFMAGWMVLVPELVTSLSQVESTADVRRQTEHVLVALAAMTSDPVFSSNSARRVWQSQVGALGKLTRHAKTTVRLAALNVVAALGQQAASISPTIVQALGDADRYVRWSAIRTLQSLGMSQEALLAVASMQNDVDAEVRQRAVAALQTMPGGSDILARQRDAEPVKTASVAEPAPVPRVAAILVEKPVKKGSLQAETAAVNKPVSAKSITTAATPNATHPAALPSIAASKTTVAAPEAVVVAQMPIITPKKPVTAALLTAAPEAPAKKAPETFPTENGTVLPAIDLTVPASKAKETPTTPMLAPAPSPQPIIQPVAARVIPTVDPLAQALAKLGGSRLGEQIDAVRTLGKLGPRAADAVPQLAEALIKNDVLVRREVPLALMQIGSAAKLAQSVLERALEDADTDVKVNAARALLELSDK